MKLPERIDIQKELLPCYDILVGQTINSLIDYLEEREIKISVENPGACPKCRNEWFSYHHRTVCKFHYGEPIKEERTYVKKNCSTCAYEFTNKKPKCENYSNWKAKGDK